VRIDAEALQRHATGVSRARLARKRGRLIMLTADERRAVEDAAMAVGRGVVHCLLEEAALDETLAGVLANLYPTVGDSAHPG
jgi:hypothetical protein